MAELDIKEPQTLVTLPYDVRFMILKNLLWRNDPIEIDPAPLPQAHGEKRNRRRTNTEIHSNILSTCKSLWSDGSHILYHMNTFKALDSSSSCISHVDWLDSIGHGNISLLTSLSVSLDHSYALGPGMGIRAWKVATLQTTYSKRWANAFASLAIMATSLKRLQIDFDWKFMDQANESAIQMITIVTAITTIHSIETLHLSGRISHVFAAYLNRRMNVPVQGPDVDLYKQPLPHVIIKLQDELHMTNVIIQGYTKDTIQPPSLYTRCLNMDEWQPGIYKFKPRLQPAAGRQLAAITRPVELLSLPHIFRGVRLCEHEQGLKMGKFWPPLNYHLEATRIERGKLDYLRDFWDELVYLRIVRRK